ncbi:hypothetical protein LRS06_08285 [Hymenobacter sp. J193]|uniref:hypothetical protein n=1 Tax=Hymenobacter sp. J193 TaxID=2898429 RepID=UPI002151BBFC|nr:hypothetical protein [Hymenobacter sp. J193]MCR5887775.1 hypothetical protein [Hymenobacter sp. J193]
MKNALRAALLLAVLGFLSLHKLLAQAPTAVSDRPLDLSLQQAIDYAIKNKSSLLATRLNEQTARAKVGEIKSAGLPQVNVAANVADNFKLQKSLVDFGALGGWRQRYYAHGQGYCGRRKRPDGKPGHRGAAFGASSAAGVCLWLAMGR